MIGGQTISLGLLPDDPLPGHDRSRLVDGTGQRRPLADVHGRGSRRAETRRQDAVVQLVAPLGDVDAQGEATSPPSHLRDGADVGRGRAGRLPPRQGRDPATHGVAARHRANRRCRSEHVAGRQSYGSTEVDDVAATLNENLQRLADETHRRGAALDAARAFAASATHELRTPLQGALINLDIARSGRIAEPDRTRGAGSGERTAAADGGHALSAVRALADAEFADRSWFDEVDLADVADAAVADERRRAPDGDDRDRVDTADHGRRLARRRQAGHRQHRAQRLDPRRAGRWCNPARRRVGRRLHRHRRRQRPRRRRRPIVSGYSSDSSAAAAMVRASAWRLPNRSRRRTAAR